MTPFRGAPSTGTRRLATEDRLHARYPETAPADFDPSYAGERWSEDD
ncbi:hypothetical protein ACFVWG_24090 [Kribbella sp. NPDC058245]